MVAVPKDKFPIGCKITVKQGDLGHNNVSVAKVVAYGGSWDLVVYNPEMIGHDAHCGAYDQNGELMSESYYRNLRGHLWYVNMDRAKKI